MTRTFTNGISPVIGIYRDIPAPDVNTNAQTMAWMMDAYSETHGHSLAIVTGKPLSLGGQPGREQATGRGVIYVLRAYARQHGLDMSGLRVAIQGFGNVGSLGRRRGRQPGLPDHRGLRPLRGCAPCDRLVGRHVARARQVDRQGQRARHGGLDLQRGAARLRLRRAHPGRARRAAARGQRGPRAGQGRRRGRELPDDAGRGQDPSRSRRRRHPDILANAGGVTGSYFEWTRNIQQMPWTEAKFNEALARLHGPRL